VTKLDQRLSDEVAKLDQRLSDEVTNLNQRLTDEVAKLDQRLSGEVTKLRVQIAEVKADLMKWMFVFTVGQTGVLLGVLLAFLRR
jgi:dsDNA-specific endonuclease/ATPase MutS2